MDMQAADVEWGHQDWDGDVHPNRSREGAESHVANGAGVLVWRFTGPWVES